MTDVKPDLGRSLKLSPLTLAEVGQIAIDLQELVGAQLQDCLQTSSEFGLAFYHRKETLWLWFDLNPLRPLVIRRFGKPPPRKKITRPLSLFMKSRFVGRRLESVRADLERGRVLLFRFHRAVDEETQAPCELEVRLFPHGQNVIARDGDKQIAEIKPKELPLSVRPEGASEIGRRWTEIEEQWSALQSNKPKAVAAAPNEAQKIEREWRRAIEKKEKALERMREELETKSSSVYSEIGEWLKGNAGLRFPQEVPKEWLSQIDTEKSVSWNIEECFRKAKENARKAEGTRVRLNLVEKELIELKARGPNGFTQRLDREKRAEGANLLNKAEARGRRMKLGEDLEVYIGKSASDNLALLRRAQPFDYWLHLRDYPGSHAILRRNRNRLVNDQELTQAGQWVIEQSLGKRAHEIKGERYDLLIVECRFVRPIKGDRLGRVNYTNDRVMTLRF